MIDLIDLEEAKDHLRVTGTRFDADIQNKILQASAIIFNYLKVNVNDSPLSVPWTGAIPWDIKAACCLVVGILNRYRDDGEAEADPLSPAVRSLLHRYRTPAMA